MLEQADINKALRCACIREFDGALLVPSYGFKDVDEYYRQQSSGHVLKVCGGAVVISDQRRNGVMSNQWHNGSLPCATWAGQMTARCTAT